MPGPTRAIHLHFLVDPSPGRSRGQPPGIAHVDGRAEEGRLLKGIRKGILDHLSAHGGEPTIVHHSLAQRAAWLGLTIAYVQNSFPRRPPSAAPICSQQRAPRRWLIGPPEDRNR